jgi:hypothetical protein
MLALIRVARIAALLVLAVAAVMLVIGLFRPETGGVEKVVLTALVAVCVAMAAGVRSAAARLQRRVR